MENKQTFGVFICQRRKELGMTQKEFAEKLYVTDSAVSKWERGLAYPDITLLQNICAVLNISEKELLSASEDTEGRRAEHLAQKYLRLTRTYRIVQYLLYGITAAACLVCNLAIQHTLSWFWIVLASEAVAASLTLLPALAPEGWRGLWCLGGFTGSLLLLLTVCCLYTGGDWLFIAAVSVIFGLGVVFLPLVLRALPAPWSRMKLTLYLAVEYLLLVLLYAVCCFHSDGTWFISAALWTLFGLATAFLPLVLRQLPLGPLSRHKALLWLSVNTILLLLGLAWEGWRSWFLPQGLLIALICLALPWGLLGCVRYLPVSRWFRAAVACFWTGLWYWLFPWCLERAMILGGWCTNNPYDLRLPVDFTNWTDWQVLSANVNCLVMLTFGVLGLSFTITGLLRRKH